MTKYKLGDGQDGTCLVDGDEELFVVAAELSDGHYCEDCELPLDACCCADAAEYDELDQDASLKFKATQSTGLWVQQYGRVMRPKQSFWRRLWRWLTA